MVKKWSCDYVLIVCALSKRSDLFLIELFIVVAFRQEGIGKVNGSSQRSNTVGYLHLRSLFLEKALRFSKPARLLQRVSHCMTFPLCTMILFKFFWKILQRYFFGLCLKVVEFQSIIFECLSCLCRSNTHAHKYCNYIFNYLYAGKSMMAWMAWIYGWQIREVSNFLSPHTSLQYSTYGSRTALAYGGGSLKISDLFDPKKSPSPALTTPHSRGVMGGKVRLRWRQKGTTLIKGDRARCGLG